MKSSTVPKKWKYVVITAIHMKGDKSSPDNYRPISLMCSVCKIMEGIIRNKMMEYLLSEDLISDKQYGFVSGRSTVTQLLKFLDDITCNRDEGLTTDVVHTDFQKARLHINTQVRTFRSLPFLRASHGLADRAFCWLNNRIHFFRL